MSTPCKLLFTLSLSAVMLIAADPTLGTWKMNMAKSKFNPGPAPTSQTTVYSQDGDWIILKSTGVDAEGKSISRENRYKRDGKEYPFNGPYGMGKIAVKKLNDHTADAVTKFDGGGSNTIHTVISKDGKTRTQTVSGVNAKGEKLHHVIVYDLQ